MPEVLEPPSTAFTPETAREAGLRSWEATKQRNQELENLRTLLATTVIEPPKPTPIVEREVQRQIELTEEQVARVRILLNDDKVCYCDTCKRGGLDGKERAALLRELRGLLEHLCRLHNIPQAPTTKAITKPPRQAPLPMPRPVAVAEQDKPSS